MGFWDLFSQKKNHEKYGSRLHQKLSVMLPQAQEQELVLVTCIAGLLARVAYADMQFHVQEIDQMERALLEWTTLPKPDVIAVLALTREEIVDLAGLENHLYCHPLNDFLSEAEKFALLKALFATAASDSSVDHLETEEIRVIAKGLLLEHRFFIAAKATVIDHLKALKG